MGQPQMLTERPAFVMFEAVSVEDRAASIAAGHYVGRDVDMAFITPAGSKDRIERVVSEWFEKLAEDQLQDRIPAEWVKHYKAVYADWKAGRVPVTTGTSILNWPGLTPSLVKTLQSLHILSVEDVAAMNEESIARVGMGGRALKQRAADFLATSNDVGKVAEAMSAMRQELDLLKGRNLQLEERAEMQARQLAALTSSDARGHAQPARASADNITAADLLDDDGPGTKL